MPTNHTDVDQFPTVVKPNDGESANVASVRQAIEPLADRAHYLKKRTFGGEVADIMGQPLFVPAASSAMSHWGMLEVVANPLGVFQVDVTSHLPLILPITNLPKQGKIVGIGMTVDPAGAHGALPAQMPRIKLYRQDTGSSSAPTLIADGTDPSASVGVYELPHGVEDVTGVAEVVAHDSGLVYFVEITGEDSTNALVNMKVTSLYLYVDPS